MNSLVSMKDFSKEIRFKTSRSGGKGGQNVNKVETKVEAWWNVCASDLFNREEKELIFKKLRNKINKEGFLILKTDETRSQLENRERALTKILDLVHHSLIVPKKRKATRLPKAAKEKRLESKRFNSEKKQMRRKDW